MSCLSSCQPAGNLQRTAKGTPLLLLKPCVAPLSPPLHCLRQFRLQNDGLWLTCPAFQATRILDFANAGDSEMPYVLAAVVTAGVTITTGFASARYTGSKVDAARYLCMFGLGGVVVAIYTFLMPT